MPDVCLAVAAADEGASLLAPAPCTPPTTRHVQLEENWTPPMTKKVRTPSAPLRQQRLTREEEVAHEREESHRAAASQELCVLGLSGVLCHVNAKMSWRVSELKAAVHASTGIPIVEQQLLAGTRELEDDGLALREAVVGSHHHHPLLLLGGPAAAVTLVRRPQDLSQRLNAIAERSLVELHQSCTREIWETRCDRHVAVAYMQRDGRLLNQLPPELRADRRVVLAAVRRWPLALEHADAALRAARDVVLAAVWQDPRALEFADEALKADGGFIAEAMQGEDHVEHLLVNPKEVLSRARAVLSCAAPDLQVDPLLQSTAGLRPTPLAVATKPSLLLNLSPGSAALAQLSPTAGQAARSPTSQARSRSRQRAPRVARPI